MSRQLTERTARRFAVGPSHPVQAGSLNGAEPFPAVRNRPIPLFRKPLHLFEVARASGGFKLMLYRYYRIEHSTFSSQPDEIVVPISVGCLFATENAGWAGYCLGLSLGKRQVVLNRQIQADQLDKYHFPG
jgi:hypothetical protein